MEQSSSFISQPSNDITIIIIIILRTAPKISGLPFLCTSTMVRLMASSVALVDQPLRPLDLDLDHQSSITRAMMKAALTGQMC